MISLIDIKDSNLLFDNHYRLISKIGGGGFSEVWLAHDTVADMDVALKIYTPSGTLDEEGKNDFKREFARLCELNHSNIIHAIGFGIHEDELPYLAMKVCENGSAENLKKNISEEGLWNFIEQVASGLQYLHNHGVVHQDLKPENVLINSDGQYLIIDFGISTKTRNTLRLNTDSNVGGGTTWYMSAESFETESPSVYARDIWALGASIYEIITGDVPFGQYGGMTQKMKGGKIPPIGQEFPFSEELKQLVYDCLALNTWDRPDANEILKRVKQHKDGFNPPKPFPFKKLIALMTTSILAVCCYVKRPQIWNIIFPPSDSFSSVDSIYLSKLDESKLVIKNEYALIKEQNEADKMSLKKICASVDSFSYLMDSISDNARKQASLEIDTITDIVKELCMFFEDRGQSKIKEYGDFGKEACDRYMSRKDTLEEKLKILTNK